MLKVSGSKASLRRLMLRSPVRIALLNTCLKGSPRQRTLGPQHGFESGSSVTVVRMAS
jgi:hypothetical protein